MWISICLSAVFFNLAFAACPGDWLSVATNDTNGNPIQTCYKIYSSQRVPFGSAAIFCQAQGGYLARDTSSSVHTVLKQALMDAVKSSTHPTTFWIGLTDNNGTGGPWRWINGPVLGTYKNFANPNVTNNPNTTDCVFISAGSTNMKWFVTTSCNQLNSFVCQRDSDAAPLVVTTKSPLNCPVGFISFPELNTCVRLFSTPKSWTDAEAVCERFSGHLAKIVNSYINTYINSLIYAQKSIYWIGLNDRANEGKFVWLNETVQTNFTNWDVLPNNGGGNENCVAIDGNKNFKWDDGDCGLLNRFVCQANPLAGTVPPGALTTPASFTNCDPGWVNIPYADNCIQFNTNVLSWMDARSTCITAGGDLPSIASGLEQIALEGESISFSSDFFWIGANDRSVQNGWQWVDGTPFAFLNWDDEQPDDSASCAAFARLSGRWDALPCQNRHGYMCMKKAKVTVPSLVTTSTTPARLPGDVTFGCPSGWNTFRGSCYIAASSSTGVNWAAANASCSGSLMQAALASITDNDENDFITSMIPDSYTGSAWIGLQDPLENTFTWEDGTPVQYTNWNPGEPNNLDNADCVLMSASNGKWTVVTCDRVVQMYICKKNKYILPFTESNENPGCPNGTLGHGTQCYNFIITARNFADAEQDCKARGDRGNLATVYGEHVQDFLTAQLSTFIGKAFWIGLSQTDSTYGWQSHWPVVSLTYWGKNHTGNEKSTCVALVQNGTTAHWENYPCSNVMSYICESTRTGFSTQVPITAVTIQQPCPSGWLGYGSNCYNFFGTGMDKQTWAGAQSTCANQAPGGSLATVADNATQAWLLKTALSSFPTMKTIWIGLNDRDSEGGYAWADNSPFTYANWSPNEPNNKLDREDCVAWIVPLNTWNDDYCYMPYSYICQVPRGSVIATAHPPPTGYITPQCGDSSWIMYNGNCYYMGPAFGVGDLATWFEARQQCLDRSADLASITSSDENGFLTMMANKISINNFWIGLNDLDLETLGWTDNSPLSYVSWNANEPNDAYGEEKCVEISSRGLWNDAQCQQKFGYFCKKKPGNFVSVQPSPTDTSGGCPRNFVSLPSLSYCYFVGGTTNATSTNYDGAMKACEQMVHKSQLASIHTKLEEKFILVLASGLRQPAWIGLNDRIIRNQFQWVDSSVVSYSHWGPGQPNENINDNSPGARQDCVDLQVRRNPGTWGDRNCNTPLAYICESKKGSTLPTSAPNTTGCLPGYQRFSNSCYKFVQDPLNWTSAESVCKADGGNLVTLNSGIEQAFAEILVQGSQTDISQFWIGLKYTLASASFAWADGWPVRYTNWGQNEPNLQKNQYCVTHTIDDHWQVSPCAMELSFVCEINFATPPPPGASSRPGRCPDSTWSNNNGRCYHIETSAPVTWAQANAACKLLGANLTSIHSDREARYLTNLIGSVGKDVWIGLYKGQGTGFTWYDGTEAEYVYWADGEPNDPDSYLHQDCVKILGQYGTWADTDCLDKNAYICETAQRGRPSLSPNGTYPTRRSGSNRTRNPNGTYPTRRSGSNRTRNPNGTNQSGRPGHSRRSSPAPGVLGQSGTTSSGLNGGSVAGLVIGMLVLVLIGVAVGFAVFRRRRGQNILPQRLQSALPGFTNVSFSNKNQDKVNLSTDA